jgi:hypothetical protein
MPRGGKRKGAGRKSEWRHRETTVIRVPEVIATELIGIAKKLDQEDRSDSVMNSDSPPVDLVTESIKTVVEQWREKASVASSKNTDWRRVRQLLGDLESAIQNGKVLDFDTESKSHPGQMSLLQERLEPSESATKSEAIAVIENSADDWLTSQECWDLLGSPGAYETFRKLDADELRQRYDLQAAPERRVKREGYRWLRIGATSIAQVHPLPEGSERSGEG